MALEQPRPTEAQINPIGPLLEIEVRALEDQLKEGHVRQFTVMCDESARVGGTDTAPAPLGYFTLGIGF